MNPARGAASSPCVLCDGYSEVSTSPRNDNHSTPDLLRVRCAQCGTYDAESTVIAAKPVSFNRVLARRTTRDFIKEGFTPLLRWSHDMVVVTVPDDQKPKPESTA